MEASSQRKPRALIAKGSAEQPIGETAAAGKAQSRTGSKTGRLSEQNIETRREFFRQEYREQNQGQEPPEDLRIPGPIAYLEHVVAKGIDPSAQDQLDRMRESKKQSRVKARRARQEAYQQGYREEHNGEEPPEDLHTPGEQRANKIAAQNGDEEAKKRYERMRERKQADSA